MTERRTDLILVTCGLVGLAVFVTLYPRAFPQASVKVELTREQAITRARAVAESLGAPVGTLVEAARFGGNTVSLLFLQRTIGLDSASRWARDVVPIWSWDARWFTPERKEEWRVGLGVDGRVVAANHLLDDAAPGDSLTREQAQPLAEAYLRRRGWDLARFELVESSSERHERRVDHTFTWQQNGTTIAWNTSDPTGGTGAVRLTVRVKGGAVGSYLHFLKVPEDFERQLSRTLSVGTFIAAGSFGFMFLLVIAALALTIVRNKSGTVAWRPAFGLAAAVALVLVATGVASWPSFKYGYTTEIPWAAFVGLAVFGLLFVATVYGAMVVFTTTAGESLGREQFPASLAGFLALARGRLLDPSIARASVRGYALGFAALGYLTVFYLFAQRYLGAWLPAEGPYSDIFNDWAPFLAPLAVGILAAVTEEITFRLFGISLVKRYLKSTALAVLLPAMVWAFAHSNYPVFPVYVRGIELTVVGVAFGLAFLHFGIVTCLVAHFVIDAVLVSMPLVASGNPAYQVPAFIVMGIALLPTVAALVRRGGSWGEPAGA